MQYITDLQIHSKYSRAVSKDMVIPKIWDWAKRKGIAVMATGDWTHPLWMREIKQNLEEMGNGLLKLKSNIEGVSWEGDTSSGPFFLLATEVSSIYSQGGKVRRIHTLIWSPTIAIAEKINKELLGRGANLISDGRPVIGLTSIQVAELVFSVDKNCLVIPAHAWTPWFSLYGSESGFDTIDECFGNYSRYIYAIETGLSSDPAMNWRIKELDKRSLVSFSDAHSGPKLGRESTVFDLTDLSYKAIREAIIQNQESGVLNNGENGNSQSTVHNQQSNHISYTLEFHPEEGKYHFSGHRNCQVKQDPRQTREKGTICPVCGRKLTIGVMHRVEQLAGRSEEELRLIKKKLPGIDLSGVYSELFPNRPPYIMLVPLQEILAEAIGGLPTSQNIQNEYRKLTDHFGGEFNILLHVKTDDITRMSGSKVAEALQKVRTGDIYVDPGYDGVFGVVKIWGEEKEAAQKEEKKDQLSLF
ncbi:endonuclease Q family protein [Patescibacteria group bacterium]|nr:endonuclease Q family protein [Patescibacteria group bacterium]